jgi:RNA polymerase sigma factor (sigma-70 family)
MTTNSMTALLQCVRRTSRTSDGDGPTDGQLLAEFLSRRDEGAFAALVRRHGVMVLGLCRRILQHPQDAEDAFQAVFLVLARKATTIRKREAVADWLFGVARRTALKARAAAARRRTREFQVTDMPHPVVEAPKGEDELLPLLDEELERLPEKYRLPIVLCELEGRKRKEVARQLKVPEGTLSSRLATARKRLAARLARRGLSLSAALVGPLLAREASAASVPAALAESTIKAAMLPGTVPAGVSALAEGVLKAMLLTRLKLTVFAVVLLLGVVATGGPMYLAQAQPPGPGRRGDEKGTDPNRAQDLAREVQELRREVERLKRRLGEPVPLSPQQEQTLETIARAIKTLRASMAGDPKRTAALDVFEKAYHELASQLRGRAGTWFFTTPDATTNWQVPPIAGVVREVFRDGLVTLAVARDAGVRPGQTLLVSRLGPRAAYLGEIKILDVEDAIVVGKIKLQSDVKIMPKDRITFKEKKQGVRE